MDVYKKSLNYYFLTDINYSNFEIHNSSWIISVVSYHLLIHCHHSISFPSYCLSPKCSSLLMLIISFCIVSQNISIISSWLIPLSYLSWFLPAFEFNCHDFYSCDSHLLIMSFSLSALLALRGIRLAAAPQLPAPPGLSGPRVCPHTHPRHGSWPLSPWCLNLCSFQWRSSNFPQQPGLRYLQEELLWSENCVIFVFVWEVGWFHLCV